MKEVERMRKPESHPLSANRLSQRMLAILLFLVLAVSMCPLPSYADEGSATLEGATDAQMAEDAPAIEADAVDAGAMPPIALKRTIRMPSWIRRASRRKSTSKGSRGCASSAMRALRGIPCKQRTQPALP